LAKHYAAQTDFRPLLTKPDATRFLGELRLVEVGNLSVEDTMLGVVPPFDATPVPERRIDPLVLRAVLFAMRGRESLDVAYQSMSRPEPARRVIEPHALAYDGFRWHTRAFDRESGEFRDFVLGRLSKPKARTRASSMPENDIEWQTFVDLIIAPHPGLTPAQSKAIAIDYGIHGNSGYAVTVTVHSIPAAVLPPARLRAALCGPEGSARHPLDTVEETGAAERPADAFRLPQPLEQDGIGLLVEKIRKVRIAFADRSERGKPVGAAPQVRTHARPRPVLRPLDKAGPNRIERYIAQRCREMIFVHRDGAEATLPEMPGALAPSVNDARVTPVHRRQRAPQPIGVGRDQDQVHMVRHQAPRPHLDLRSAACRAKQIAVQRIVFVMEKRPRPTVATLGDMMRHAGNDDTRKSGHVP
jgi:hypothetical protein